MYIQKDQLAELLRDKDFRRQFTADFLHEFLAAQIRALREKKPWTQEELGAKAGQMDQVQVSRLENPDYPGGSLRSITRIAQAFDVALLVRFAPFSELVEWGVNLNPQRLAPLSFEEEHQLSFPLSFAQVGVYSGITNVNSNLGEGGATTISFIETGIVTVDQYDNPHMLKDMLKDKSTEQTRRLALAAA